MSKETFAARLARLRAARGLSQNQLAKLAGLAASTISHLEAEKRRPSLLTAVSLAYALDISVDEMAGVPKKGERDE